MALKVETSELRRKFFTEGTIHPPQSTEVCKRNLETFGDAG
jgi:hypothetical protein